MNNGDYSRHSYEKTGKHGNDNNAFTWPVIAACKLLYGPGASDSLQLRSLVEGKDL